MSSLKNFISSNVLLSEGTMWKPAGAPPSDQRPTKDDFLKDNEKIATAFLFEFIGMLALYDVADQKARLKTHFMSDKSSRTYKMTDDNNNFSLIFKVVADKRWFKNKATVEKISRFMFKLKSGTVSGVLWPEVRKWLDDMVPSMFPMSLPAQLRTTYTDFRVKNDAALFAKDLKSAMRRYMDDNSTFMDYAKIISIPASSTAQPIAPVVTAPASPTTPAISPVVQKGANKGQPASAATLRVRQWRDAKKAQLAQQAGAGCLIMAEESGRVLVGLRGRGVAKAGTWSYPGGAIDHNEDPLKAAIREAEEEIGLKSQYIKEKEKLFEFKDGSFTYTTFLFIVKREFRAKETWEHPKLRWFSLLSLPQPLHPGFKSLLDNDGVRNKLVDMGLEYAAKNDKR